MLHFITADVYLQMVAYVTTYIGFHLVPIYYSRCSVTYLVPINYTQWMLGYICLTYLQGMLGSTFFQFVKVDVRSHMVSHIHPYVSCCKKSQIRPHATPMVIDSYISLLVPVVLEGSIQNI